MVKIHREATNSGSIGQHKKSSIADIIVDDIIDCDDTETCVDIPEEFDDLEYIVEVEESDEKDSEPDESTEDDIVENPDTEDNEDVDDSDIVEVEDEEDSNEPSTMDNIRNNSGDKSISI